MARNKFPEETIKLILDVASRLFAEKGYDHTSLQDIIQETKLSKGAIYHHFRSKEDIFESICDRIGQENTLQLAKIRDNKALNGNEKLKAIFLAALSNPNQNKALNLSPDLLENPRFLAMQIKQIYGIVVPEFIEPILQEGMADGSIAVEHPEELAEAMMILSNLWLNPLVSKADVQTMERRCQTFDYLLKGIGLNLMDEALMEAYKKSVTNK